MIFIIIIFVDRVTMQIFCCVLVFVCVCGFWT